MDYWTNFHGQWNSVSRINLSIPHRHLVSEQLRLLESVWQCLVHLQHSLNDCVSQSKLICCASTISKILCNILSVLGRILQTIYFWLTKKLKSALTSPCTDSLRAALPSVVLSTVETMDDGISVVEPGTNNKMFVFHTLDKIGRKSHLWDYIYTLCSAQ